MAFKAADGKQFGNRQRAARYDEVHKESAKKGSENPADVVGEHGPATHIEIAKSKGAHHLTSRHADGHVHKSAHATSGQAVDEARTLSGADDEQTGDEAPDMEGGEPDAAPMMSGKLSTSIPGV
jgi:hypothetical protein